MHSRRDMGLDQYAKKVKSDYDRDSKTETIVKTTIAYWRKHNALQGWMESLWRTKTGDGGEFNCVSVELEESDLDMLETVLKAGNLPPTKGFFFGGDTSVSPEDASPEDREWIKDLQMETFAFINYARKAISEGYTIEYSSWW